MLEEKDVLVKLVKKLGADETIKVYNNFVNLYKTKHNLLDITYLHNSTLLKINNRYFEQRAQVFNRYARINYKIK
jgi:hypothetical protein